MLVAELPTYAAQAGVNGTQVAQPVDLAPLGPAFAALAVGLAALGAGIAERGIGAAAVGALAEDSISFGIALVMTVLPETLVILALVTIFLV